MGRSACVLARDKSVELIECPCPCASHVFNDSCIATPEGGIISHLGAQVILFVLFHGNNRYADHCACTVVPRAALKQTRGASTAALKKAPLHCAPRRHAHRCKVPLTLRAERCRVGRAGARGRALREREQKEGRGAVESGGARGGLALVKFTTLLVLQV